MSKALTATDILKQRVLGNNPERLRRVEEHKAAMEIATQIYEVRIEAGLSQKELARLVGTSQSAISRLESADYDGHSLKILQRIAAALGQRVEVRFVPTEPAIA